MSHFDYTVCEKCGSTEIKYETGIVYCLKCFWHPTMEAKHRLHLIRKNTLNPKIKFVEKECKECKKIVFINFLAHYCPECAKKRVRASQRASKRRERMETNRI